jgi:hypothetical protein
VKQDSKSKEVEMADIAVERDALIEQTGFRLSWGAIFAGLFVAVGVHLVLSLAGVAIGLTAWSPATPGGADAGDVAMGVGIWAAIAALIALFAGGATTGRLAGILRRKDGFLHGAVLWSLTTVATVWLMVSGLGFLLGGAFNIVGQTAAATVQAAAPAALEVAGPGLTAAVRGEEREVLVSEISQRTGMTRTEAESVVAESETRAQATRERIAQETQAIREDAPMIAEDAADRTARGAWWTLLALGLSFGAATAGASLTARE